jgi:hypothetical protein
MAAIEKLDLFKQHKHEYAATRVPALVKIGAAGYLCIGGRGAPGGSAFTEAIAALYGVAFTIKMTRKFAGERDYIVAKLEAIWPNMDFEEVAPDKEQWIWQLMIRTPKFVTQSDIAGAREALVKRGKKAAADQVELRALTEGTCVQALHVGSYDDEGKTVGAMRAFAARQGLRIAGAHHEIYLSDPRRGAPSKLRTILRQPVTKERG